ncbi:hypothetical protein RJ641_003731 [Dillenia turbinata]|uniref:Uncharacterized protein n=1 Tax=Dillenia turbinata TaxID=194707 RepID=A0AAN8VLN7_9MAGN
MVTAFSLSLSLSQYLFPHNSKGLVSKLNEEKKETMATPTFLSNQISKLAAMNGRHLRTTRAFVTASPRPLQKDSSDKREKAAAAVEEAAEAVKAAAKGVQKTTQVVKDAVDSTIEPVRQMAKDVSKAAGEMIKDKVMGK